MNQSKYKLSALAGGLLAAAASFLLVVPVAAQTGSITGSVVSAGTGQRLEAVLVSVAGTNLGSLTRATGRFLILNVPAGQQTLEISLIGFATTTQVVTVTAGAPISVTLRLETEAISLREIVVTGVQGATARLKLPFEVAQVLVGDLVVPTINAAQAIQGKVAGAQVVQGSGRPGSAPSILLRGATSIDASGRSQEPLYIVDGVILGASLVDLDALDIQSIEIVKGAAAASLYGSRAANGVVQIRTKRGAEMADNTVQYTFRTEYGGSSLDHTPTSLLTEKHEWALSPDGSRFVDFDGSFCEWVDDQTDTFIDSGCASPQLAGQNAGGGPATEWNTFQNQAWPGETFDQVQRFFTGGNLLQSNLSVSGRSGNTNFHISASYLDQEGIMSFTEGFDRANIRVNVDQEVSQDLLVQTSVFYSKSTQGRPQESAGNTLFDLTRMPAGVDLLAIDTLTGELRLLVNPTLSESANPLYELQNFERTEWRSRFLASASVRYAPTTWLKVDGNVSFDRLDDDQERLRPKGFLTIRPRASVNEGTLFKFRSRNEALNTSITASTRFDVTPDIVNSTQIRYLYEDEDFESFFSNGFEFAVGDVPTFGNINQDNLTSGSFMQTIRADGYFLITNFDMYDKYIIDALVRNDGSSLFGEDERRQWYTRIGGAWRLGAEDFFNIDAIDELKFRYSRGTAGGRPNFSAQYETYSVSGGRISPVSLGNTALKPEFSTEHEVGLDMGIFNYKAILSLTYARATTRDQILLVPQPAFTGFQTQWKNAGTIQSKTWEATLDLRLVETDDFSWRTKFLFDATKSRITALTVPAFQYGVSGQALGTVFYAREGERIGTFYGTIFATGCGDLPASAAGSCSEFTVNDDGLLVWVGPGGNLSDNLWGDDGLAVEGRTLKWGTPFAGFCTDRATGDETQFCKVGNTMPAYNLSLSTTATWKGVSLYALLSRSANFDVYNQPLQWGTFRRLSGVFQQEGVPAADQKPIGYHDAWYGVSGLKPSSLFVEDASFTKLREVSLSYRLSPEALGSVPGLDRFSSIGISFTGPLHVDQLSWLRSGGRQGRWRNRILGARPGGRVHVPELPYLDRSP